MLVQSYARSFIGQLNKHVFHELVLISEVLKSVIKKKILHLFKTGKSPLFIVKFGPMCIGGSEG